MQLILGLKRLQRMDEKIPLCTGKHDFVSPTMGSLNIGYPGYFTATVTVPMGRQCLRAAPSAEACHLKSRKVVQDNGKDAEAWVESVQQQSHVHMA